MVLEEANSSSFNLELMDDTQDSIDPSLISENCALFYERGEQGYICKVCDHQYASRRYVLFHLTNSHSIPTHSWPTCDKCGKIFTKPSKLAVHINNHPKIRPEKPSETANTPHVTQCVTSNVKVVKSPPTEHSKSKHRTPKPKLLTVYFIRTSLPNTYKSNPHKCGKCFKSFLTSEERDLHRDLIHRALFPISANDKPNSAKKTKRKLKRMNLNKLMHKHKHEYNSNRTVNNTLPVTSSPAMPHNKKKRRSIEGSTSFNQPSSHKRVTSTSQLLDTDNDSSLSNFIRRERSTSPFIPDSDLNNTSGFLLKKSDLDEGMNNLVNQPNFNDV